jgi:hypothetical protein
MSTHFGAGAYASCGRTSSSTPRKPQVLTMARGQETEQIESARTKHDRRARGPLIQLGKGRRRGDREPSKSRMSAEPSPFTALVLRQSRPLPQRLQIYHTRPREASASTARVLVFVQKKFRPTT